jgi:alpha-beta hydrolase superfamily lysophospholipase
VLFCIHGLGLHKGSYEAFGRTMAKDGYITYAIDVRGFGAWVSKAQSDQLDFNAALLDIKRALLEIRKNHPGLPIIVVGESMGGAIGIHTVALYPDLTDGLVSSVPSGDRFNSADSQLSVGLHAFFGGFNKKMDVGSMVIGKATTKEDLRERWSKDKLARKEYSPAELMTFQSFMNKNPERAGAIKDKPVLIIAGTDDKLVRPAANNQLFENLTTPNKTCVYSAAAEHLIFEEGQFKPEDITYVSKWLTKNVLNRGKEEPSVEPEKASQPDKPTKPPEENVAMAPPILVKPATNKPQGSQAGGETIQVTGPTAALSYWIELYRDGKVYRCNNKMAFKSGDAIRFHIISQNPGYAYILMKQSSSGKKAVLFPPADSKINNYLNAGTDYPLPYQDWLSFDKNPGIEKVSLIFSKSKLAASQLNPPQYLTAYISNDHTGAKDLVPTRMQLSWDDPTPVILPGEMPSSQQSQLAQNVTSTGSMVKVVFKDVHDLFAIDVALAHQ